MKRMGKNINDKIVDFPKERQESIEKRFQQLKSGSMFLSMKL
jgi:hypothetical protein